MKEIMIHSPLGDIVVERIGEYMDGLDDLDVGNEGQLRETIERLINDGGGRLVLEGGGDFWEYDRVSPRKIVFDNDESYTWFLLRWT